MYCDKCGNKYIDFEGECAACKFSAISAAFSDFGIALGEGLRPLVESIGALAKNFPDEKQIARLRSRDDLQAKRKQSRRGGSMYRSR